MNGTLPESQRDVPASADRKVAPRVHLVVHGTDYFYTGILVAAFPKLGGAIRYVVEDSNGRLFIHNAKQIGKPEGWMPGDGA